MHTDSITRNYGKIGFLYLISFLQGVSWTVLPSISGVLLVDKGGSLTHQQYGLLFIPFILFGIISSKYSGYIGYLRGARGCLQFGLFFHFLSQLGLTLSKLLQHHSVASFVLFLGSQAFLGLAVGATLTSLNVYANLYVRMSLSRATVLLYSTMTFGGAVFPFLIACLNNSHDWWILSAVLSTCFLALFFMTVENLDLAEYKTTNHLSKNPLPLLMNQPMVFWVFLLIALIYGFTENTLSNWGTLFILRQDGFSFDFAELGLIIYWSAFCLGQLFIFWIAKYISTIRIYSFLPLVMAFSFALIPKIQELRGEIVVYLLAGLGCSAFFPLTVGLGEKLNSHYKEIISGLLVTCYFIGLGVSSLMNGFLHNVLSDSFKFSFYLCSILSFLIFVFSLMVARYAKNDLG